MATSCSHYFLETIKGAQRAGVDTDFLLSNVGLSYEQVSDPLWRGDVELLARLVQLVWYALNDEFMGFTEKAAKPGTFAMMLHCIIASPSLERAIRNGIRFYDLFTDDIKMSLDIENGDACFAVTFRRPELDPEHYFLEFWLTIWYRLLGWLSGALLPLKRVTLAYPPPETYIEEFKHIFGGTHNFNARKTAFYFNSEHLARPVQRSRQELKHFLSVAPLGFMMMPTDQTSLARRVRAILLSEQRLPLSFPRFDEMAAELYMSEQTLRRRLKLESTSYRSIKAGIRRDIAIQKLMHNQMPVQEIAFLLGYTESRAFTRAFRQWTGFSPVQYRNRLKEQLHCKRSTASPAFGS